MTDCNCDHPLNDSLYMERRGQRLKSCPSCSDSAGRHVFYAFEHFGMRTMADGHVIVQSWCPSCRSKSAPEEEPAYRCP